MLSTQNDKLNASIGVIQGPVPDIYKEASRVSQR